METITRIFSLAQKQQRHSGYLIVVGGLGVSAERHCRGAVEHILQKLLSAIAREQLQPQAVVNVQQVVRVFARIAGHLLAQWSNSPVRELVLLVRIHIAATHSMDIQYSSRDRSSAGENALGRPVLLVQVRQREPRQPQHARGLPCIEHVDNVQAEISLQPEDV